MSGWLGEYNDPLDWVKIIPPDTSHITIKSPKTCNKCSNKPCTFICPSQVYLWRDEEKLIEVRFERCMECGACVIACPTNIELHWPPGGIGIDYGYWH